MKNMIELLTRRPTTSLHERWYHSENDFSHHIRIGRIALWRFYSDDSGIHLRESIFMETNIGIICSDHFVELHHEMLKRDLDEIREICFFFLCYWYSDIWKSAVHRESSDVTTSVHTTENINIFSIMNISAAFKTDPTQLLIPPRTLHEVSDRRHLYIILYNCNFRYRIPHQYYWFG